MRTSTATHVHSVVNVGFTVDYTQLCRKPRAVLEDVERFLLAHGVTVRVKDDVPESFVESRGRLLDGEIERRIR